MSKTSDLVIIRNPDVLLSSVLYRESKDDKNYEVVAQGTDKPIHYSLPALPPTAVEMMKSVFRPGKTYRARLTRLAVLTSSGAGALLAATAIHPSQFTQYTALAALFTEARLRSTKIHYNFCIPSTVPIAFYSSFDPNSDGSVPSSVALIAAIPGSKQFNPFNVTSTPINTWNIPAVRPWSRITATGSEHDPQGGVIGAWSHGVFSAVSNSTNVAYYLIECDYEFRNPI
jgi:hypothetical protein